MISSLATPLHSLNVILRHAVTVVVRDTKIVLSKGVSLISSLAIPLHSLNVILRHAVTVVVRDTKIVLSKGVSLLSSRENRLHGTIDCFDIIDDRSEVSLISITATEQDENK